RTLQLPAKLQAADRPEGQQGPSDRKGDRDSALPLSGGTAAGLARDAAAGSLGLQFRRDHAYARNACLSPAPEGREGCRQSIDPCDGCGWLQARTLGRV